MGDLLVDAGSALALVLAMAACGGPVLKLGRWLGKISYSMYLNHMLELNAALVVLLPRWGGVWLAAIPGSVLLGWALQRLVEAPAIGLARRVFRGAASRPIASAA